MEKEQVAEKIRLLQALAEELKQIEKKENTKVNFFYATGMMRQEVKHSAFFAWLLDPEKPHGLGQQALVSFCERLFCYQKQNPEVEIPVPNAQILKNIETDTQGLCGLIQADENHPIRVATEVVTHEGKRIDILIDIPLSKTVIVIENKIFTTSHDDQLHNYENYIAHSSSGFEQYRNKIYVYLSPKGETPYNIGGEEENYNDKWCIFDYREILKICRELAKQLPRTTEGKKLKYLLEDYIEMGKTNILMENQELINACKQIRREHSEAIDILLSYTDNAEEVLTYCTDWLHANVDGFHMHKQTKLSLEFYTDAIEAYFKKYGEGILTNGGRLKLRCSILCADGPMMITLCLEKDRDAEWSTAQLKIRDALLQGRSMGGLYCSKNMCTVLPNENRFGRFDEALRSEVDKELNKFVKDLQEQMATLLG